MNRTLKIAIAVLGSLVLMVAGAVAYAAFPTTDGVVSSCVTKPGGVIRIIDPATQSCKKGEVPLNWNQQGVPGVSGYEKVVSTRSFAPGTGAAFAVSKEADCPTGKVATGGGGSFVDANGDPVFVNSYVTNASFATNDSTGWVVVLTGGSFDSLGVTGISTHVFCISAS